jgi:hypothetical protein
MPGPVTAFFGVLADALTPCALFAIALGLSIDGRRANVGQASLLSAVKLVVMPLIVYGLSLSLLDPLYTIAAVQSLPGKQVISFSVRRSNGRQM